MDGANSCINLTKENLTFSNIMKMFPIFEKIKTHMGIDPYSAVNETLKYFDLRNKGREAFLNGDYSKAERNYRKSIEISEKAFAPSDLNSIPASIGLCESYIRLKDWQQAKIIDDNLMPIAKKYKHQDCIRVTVELLDEIEQVNLKDIFYEFIFF
jgi:tetratricopeptide (TPR) repeat protein